MATEIDLATENNFTYHKPFGSQPERYTAIRAKAKELAYLILDACQHSLHFAAAHVDVLSAAVDHMQQQARILGLIERGVKRRDEFGR